MTRRLGSAAGLLGVWLALLACAAPPPPTTPPEHPAPRSTAERDARIQELEAAIAKDEAAIKAMISDPARVPGLREDPELLEIADRLPRLQAELAELRPATPLEPSGPTPREDEANPETDPAPPGARDDGSADVE